MVFLSPKKVKKCPELARPDDSQALPGKTKSWWIPVHLTSRMVNSACHLVRANNVVRLFPLHLEFLPVKRKGVALQRHW